MNGGMIKTGIIILQVKPDKWNSIKDELILVEKKIFGRFAFDEKDFSTFREPCAYNLIVYSSGRIVGYLMSQKLSKSGMHNGMKHKDKIFYLESMGLLEQYRGKGIGKQLMDLYRGQGIRLGCDSYLLDTREKPMIALAEHYGFKKRSYNKLHSWDGKKWNGAWIMTKEIVKNGGRK